MADVSLIAGTVLPAWSENVTDNITSRNAYFRYLRNKDKQNPNGRKGYRVVDGGREFRETIFGSTNSTFRGYADRATIDTTASEEVKEAQFAQKIIAGTINLSKLEDAQNMPAYQIHDLLETKMQIAEASMEEILGDSTLADGTTDTTLPGGLQAVCPTTDGSYGTIDGSLLSYWRPQRDTSGVTAWNTSNSGLIKLDALYENCTRGEEHPDLIVTTVAIKSLINIMNILRLTINTNMNTESGNIGINDTYYRDAKVLADDNVPSGNLYLVNTRHFRFSVLRKGEFKTTKMKEPIDGLYSVMQMFVFCNFTCSQRRVQGLMTAITG